MKQIGVISDTHGLLRDGAVEALQGVDIIIHAGDIGTTEVIDKLNQIAPVFAVRGNCDTDQWAQMFNETKYVKVEDILIYIIHDLNNIHIDPKKSGCGIVISGHSHEPKKETVDDVLFLNPGSAGPSRFNLPTGLARLIIDEGNVEVEFIWL